MGIAQGAQSEKRLRIGFTGPSAMTVSIVGSNEPSSKDAIEIVPKGM